MDQVDTNPSEEVTLSADADVPRLLDWIWHPWYAKLWWAAIAAFWAGALLYSLLGIHGLPVSGTVLMYLAVILHPQAALLVLGCGYARALLKHHRGQARVTIDEEDAVGVDLFSRERFMSYLSDPADPRSPLSPLNPASPRYIHRHDR